MLLTLEDLQDGYCHIFAIALHLQYGYEIEVILEERLICSEIVPLRIGIGLVHAYCLHPHFNVIDARGRREREQVHSEYKPLSENPFIQKINAEDLWFLIETEPFPTLQTPCIINTLKLLTEAHHGI